YNISGSTLRHGQARSGSNRRLIKEGEDPSSRPRSLDAEAGNQPLTPDRPAPFDALETVESHARCIRWQWGHRGHIDEEQTHRHLSGLALRQRVANGVFEGTWSFAINRVNDRIRRARWSEREDSIILLEPPADWRPGRLEDRPTSRSFDPLSGGL